MSIIKNQAINHSEYNFLLKNLLNEPRHLVQSTIEWISCYNEFYLKPDDSKEPVFLSFYDDEKYYGFLNLQSYIKKTSRLINKCNLEILGRGPTDFFYPMVLHNYEEKVAEEFAEWLYDNKNDWDELTFSELPENWNGIDRFTTKISAKKFKISIAKTSGFYYVDTTQDWETYFNTFLLPKNKDLFKDLRGIERNGIVLELESHRKNVYEKLEQVIHLYARRRDSLNQVNSYDNSARRDFVRDITKKYEKNGWVELSFLKDQYQNIWAFQLDWIFNGIRYHWNHAYNEDFKKYSPGKILLYKLMERAFHCSAEIECNHMRGLSGYKNKLADKKSNLLQIHVNNPYSKRNQIANLYFRLSYLKKLLKF